MSPLTADRYHAEITGSTAALAALASQDDLARPVPTCPGWTLRQLITHVGRAQRWAAEIAATRSAEFIPFRSVPEGRLPDDPAQRPGWLRDGAALLIATVSEAGDATVWALGRKRPAGFWARRMAHETAVHRADAEITVGVPPVIAGDLAADGIDEWLTELSAPADGEPDLRSAALPAGQSLHVHAADVPGGEWLVRHGEDGITVRREHGHADVALRGPASALLLVLLRRLPPDDPAVQVLGDQQVLRDWLAGTAF
ncbi:MAG: maleylpyruvate isomerase family mycothiol-dependent enzyme [Streptosporangiales bacterium]